MRSSALLPVGFVFLALGALGCAGSGSTHSSWDLAADFSTVSNPSGPWQYGEQVTGAFVASTSLGYNFGPAWGGVISVNKTGQVVDGIQPNAADLDADKAEPDARWVAPYSGTFNINVQIGGSESDNGVGNEDASTGQLLINGTAAPETSDTNNVLTYTVTGVSITKGQDVDVIIPQKLGGGNTQVVFQITSS